VPRLQKEKSLASNIKDATNRKEVTKTLSSMIANLQSYRVLPVNGLAMYSGHCI